MNLSQSFFFKLNQKSTQQSSIKIKQYSLFHDLIVSNRKYEGRDAYIAQKNEIVEQDNEQKFTNLKTSFYRCKRFEPNVPFDRLPTLIVKRIAYRKQNKVDQWGRVIYNDTECKNIDHISTEFHCYQLLKGSHRAVQLYQFLHENVKSNEDKKFFYQFLKLSDRRSQGVKNIMFILEQMDDGSLKDQIDRIINKKRQKFTQQEIIEYACQIAQGLLQFKQRGIIHRDLRPENILFKNKQIKFSDFDSAFIKGYSDYKNIKNGVHMKDTTPLQIMMLISDSQQNLKKSTSEELYELQKNADIYFLGVNIYTMIFSHPFQSFNGGKVLNNLINMKKRNGFSPKLLDLMARCLQKDSHLRIDLDTVIKNLSQIERQTYFKSSSYTRVYLSPEPLNLYTFTSNQTQDILVNQDIDPIVIDPYDMNKQFAQRVRLGTVQRFTERSSVFIKDFLAQKQNQNLWHQSQSQALIRTQQTKLRNLVQQHLERLQIKAFYYELAYRILCQVNLDNLIVQSQNCYLQNIQSHLDLLSNELVVILSFLYDIIIKCSFTEDPNYVKDNIGYENKRVFSNIRLLFSRKSFFTGRKKVVINSFNVSELQQKLRQYKQAHKGQQYTAQIEQIEEGITFVIKSIKKVQSLQKLVQEFYETQYESTQKRKSFWFEYTNLRKFLDKIQKIAKDEMIQTIINLIIAYQKLKVTKRNHVSNLKNAIFMLMILQSQNTNKIYKSDMVVIKAELTSMINLRLGWKSQELQAFFNNYTEIHQEQVAQGLFQMQSQAILKGISTQNLQPQVEQEPKNYSINVEEPPKIVLQKKPSSKEDLLKISNKLQAKASMEQRSNVSFQVQQQPENENQIEDIEQIPEIKIKQPQKTLKTSMGQTFQFQFEGDTFINNRQSIKVEQMVD